MLDLSTELITKGKLAIIKSVSPSSKRIQSDEGLTLETLALQSLYGGQITFSYHFC